MEETLGKRIAKNRKRLGLTQDRLAELLGVTAQAVSKWENDQSCPDISTLPKLANIFHITTDELLGNGRTVEAQVEETTEEHRGEGVEISVHSGRKPSLALGLWLLIAGCAAFLASIRRGSIPFWTVLWTSGLLTYGLFGLYPKISPFRLSCAVAGGYFLAGTFLSLPGIEWPVVLIVLGLLLLVRAMQKQQDHSFIWNPREHIHIKGRTEEFTMNGEHFHCQTSFGERRNLVSLQKLSGGCAECSFGKLVVDLSGCGEIAQGAQIELDCAFGELQLLVPDTCRVVSRVSSAFGNFEMVGQPSPGADRTLVITGSVNFGQGSVRYL